MTFVCFSLFLPVKLSIPFGVGKAIGQVKITKHNGTIFVIKLTCNKCSHPAHFIRCMGKSTICAFDFAPEIVQYFFFLNPKFQGSSLFLRLYWPVCVGPGRNPQIVGFLPHRLISLMKIWS